MPGIRKEARLNTPSSIQTHHSAMVELLFVSNLSFRDLYFKIVTFQYPRPPNNPSENHKVLTLRGSARDFLTAPLRATTFQTNVKMHLKLTDFDC